MGRGKKGKKKSAGRGQGRGGRQPQGQVQAVTGTGGVVRRHAITQKNRRGGGRGGSQMGRNGPGEGKKAQRAAAAMLGAVETEVREDGMIRHQEILKAHTDAIMSIVILPDSIYTASRDKKLKRWRVGRNAQTGSFELNNELEVALPDLCWCMISVGDWLFCGLGTGIIRGYNKNGGEATMSGHTKRVSTIIQHEHVLLSGSADGTVRLWQCPDGQTFSTTHTISEGLPGNITSMKILGGSQILWVGGSSGVVLVDLATLRVAKQIMPKKSVAGLLEFQGHMITVYSDGASCIFDATGNQTHSQPPMPAGPITCVAGLQSGPRVLCGHAKGQVSSIQLPMFTLKRYWQAMERCKVTSVCSAEDANGVYLVGAENGTLQLWKREDVSDI